MKNAIGIDVGGSKIAIGVVNPTGTILSRRVFSTEPDKDFERALDRIKEAAAELSREEIAGIGIGCTGPVNPLRGTIHNPYTLPGWDGCDMVAPLREHFGVPVFLENDADAALLGEAFAGAARGCTHAVMLTFGTGIGGAVLIHGRIHRGCNGEHPELGHIPINPAGPDCYCGRNGCLESIASGTAISKTAQAAGFENSHRLFAAAAKDDSTARHIVNQVIQATSTAVWTLLHTILPERIILGGGIMDEHYDLFEPSIQATIQTATLVPRQHITVSKAQLGNDAGLVGAAWLAMFPERR